MAETNFRLQAFHWFIVLILCIVTISRNAAYFCLTLTKKVQICFFIAFVLWLLQQIQKPVCWFGDDDIGRPYTDFKTLYAVDEQTRRMIRHQECLDQREKRMIITYHDNMYVPLDQEDIHLLALQQAGGRVGYIASEYWICHWRERQRCYCSYWWKVGGALKWTAKTSQCQKGLWADYRWDLTDFGMKSKVLC